MIKRLIGAAGVSALAAIVLVAPLAEAGTFSAYTPFTVGASTAAKPYISVIDPGFFGIGTDKPVSVFHLESSMPAITLKKPVTGQFWQMRNGGAATGSTNFDVYNLNTKKSALSVSTDGNVTVGSHLYNSNSRLYVWGGPQGANIDVRGDQAVVGGDQATIELEGWDYDTMPNSVLLQYYGPKGMGKTMGYANNRLGHLSFQDGNTALIHTTNNVPLIIGTNEIERMRIGGDGKIGVGTKSPASIFHVSGGSSATTTITIGEINAAGSKSCVNMNTSAGTASSFYINADNQMVVEAGYCK